MPLNQPNVFVVRKNGELISITDAATSNAPLTEAEIGQISIAFEAQNISPTNVFSMDVLYDVIAKDQEAKTCGTEDYATPPPF